MPNMQRFHTSLNLSQSNEWVQVFRSGDWTNSYKNFKVSPKELDQFVENFDANILELENKEIQFNYSHNSNGMAAVWITAIRRNGNFLEAQVRWTRAGKQAIEEEEFKYVSAELAFVYKNEETGAETKNVLTGAALTNIPFVRGMKAVALSDENEGETKEFLYLHNPNNMDAFKVMLSALQGKDAVSLDEAEVLNKMFATLSEAEQAEVKEEVEAIEPTEEVEEKEEVEEVTSGEEAKEETEPEEAKEGNLSQDVALSEMTAKLSQVQAELSAKQAELDKQKLDARKVNLSANLKELSDNGMILPKQEESITKLALSLPLEKQNTLLSIFNAGEPVVELNNEMGSAEDADLSSEDALVKKAEQLSKDENISFREAVLKLSK